MRLLFVTLVVRYYALNILINIAKMKNTIATPKVKIEMTFSAPLSLVLTKTLRPPPVIAPEAPSDFPPWSKQRTIIMILVANKIQSYHANISATSFIGFEIYTTKNRFFYQYKLIFAYYALYKPCKLQCSKTATTFSPGRRAKSATGFSPGFNIFL